MFFWLLNLTLLQNLKFQAFVFTASHETFSFAENFQIFQNFYFLPKSFWSHIITLQEDTFWSAVNPKQIMQTLLSLVKSIVSAMKLT